MHNHTTYKVIFMGKKKSKNKKKQKKVSAKREKYAKFKREKPGTLDLKMPDLDPEQQKQKQQDEIKINRFLRFSRNPPTKEIRKKVKTKGKRKR